MFKSLRFYIVLFVLMFLCFRLFYLVNYLEIIGFSFDSLSYYSNCTYLLNNGKLPQFLIRTPLYPILIYCLSFFSIKFSFVILFQIFFSLFTGVFTLIIFHKTHKESILFIFLSLVAFYNSSLTFEYETYVQTESIFSNFVILFISGLFPAIIKQSRFYYFFVSLCLLALVLIRPVALCLFPLLILISIFIFRNDLNYKKSLFNLLCPLFFGLFIFLTYNFFTYGKFSYSPFGPSSYVCNISHYIQKNNTYTFELNTSIDSIKKLEPFKSDYKILNSTTKIDTFSFFFGKNYARTLDIYYHIYDSLNKQKLNHIELVSLMSSDFGLAANNTITSNPKMFFKTFFINVLKYFKNGFKQEFFYNDVINKRISYYKKALNRKYYNQNLFRYYNGDISENLIDSYLKKYEIRLLNFHALDSNLLMSLYSKIHNLVFRNYLIWIFNIIAVFFILTSFFFKINIKFFDFRINFFMVCISLMFLLNICLISLTQNVVHRYILPFELVTYLNFTFLIVVCFEIFKTKLKKIKSKHKI